MSESRNNGGSRSSDESRYVSYSPPLRQPTPKSKPNYNNLDNVDLLIARLESEIPKEESISTKVNSAYNTRRRKIEELKLLQREAREEEARQRKISQAEDALPHIQEGNDELDEAISQVRQLVKKPTQSYETMGYTYWDDGESHDGESRW